MGDPVEIASIQSVFKKAPMPLVVSAVKASAGHTESAAGLTGLFHVLYCGPMVGKILNFHSLNSFIGPAPFEATRAVLPLEVWGKQLKGFVFDHFPPGCVFSHAWI